MDKLDYPIRYVLGVPIAALSLSQIPVVVKSFLKRSGKKIFCYVNAHCLNLAQQDEQYRQILIKATLVYSGGLGPVLAAKILQRPLVERTPTPDFIDQILQVARKESWSLYLLGSQAEVVKAAAQKLEDKFPGVVCGYHHGYFRDDKRIIKAINGTRPTIVLVGMGSPKQEKWINKNIDKVNAEVFWAVGAMFEVVAGKRTRGPVWMRKAGMEWLWRFFQEPGRLWRRYLVGNIFFLMRIFIRCLRDGLIIVVARGKRLIAKIKIQATPFYSHRDRKTLLVLARALSRSGERSLSREEKKSIGKIEALRCRLEASRQLIEVIDYGRRSPKAVLTAGQMYRGEKMIKTVGEICHSSSKSYGQALLLFRLVRQFKPSQCLELGTCLGISTAYQATALEFNGGGRLTTIDGADTLVKLARANLGELKIKKAQVVGGRFQDVLPGLLLRLRPIDFVFMDGHHDEKATLVYFEGIVPYLSSQAVVVLDDILWSAGMRRAWREIKSRECVKFSIDLFNMGIGVIKS